MHLTILAAFFEVSRTPAGMCAAAIAFFLIGVLAARKDFVAARGMEKIVALVNLCVAIPLAVFSAEHFFSPQSLLPIVPAYMPWRMFWVYFVGCALTAAALSIATKVGVQWSGLLLGIMMFLFVAMLYIPGALRQPHNRIIWTIVFRETSFGGAGWLLAGNAMERRRGQSKRVLINVGRVAVTMALIVFGVEHFLHPMGLPGVPLEKEMPAWVPARVLIDYVTGAALLIAAASVLLGRKARTVTTCAGGWILLTIVVIYVPVMILALLVPDTGVKVEGINYFADTLLFAGAILALASALPRSDAAGMLSAPRSVGETLSRTQ